MKTFIRLLPFVLPPILLAERSIARAQSWIEAEETQLWSSEPQDWELLGSAVEIRGDLAVVGAIHDTNELGVAAGAAYVFERVGTTWLPRQKLLSQEPGSFFHFGESVAIGAGGTIVVGAPDVGNSSDNIGAVYVFESCGGAWTLSARLDPPSGALDGQFGSDVAIDSRAHALARGCNSERRSQKTAER